MGIGDVLATLRPEFPDVTISKIRFLESEGLVQPQRTASGYRKFSHADLERLRYVLACQRDQYLPLKVIRDHPPVLGDESGYLRTCRDERPDDAVRVSEIHCFGEGVQGGCCLVQLPGGAWTDCRRSCEETLRVQTVDLTARDDSSLAGYGTLQRECGIFGCLHWEYSF